MRKRSFAGALILQAVCICLVVSTMRTAICQAPRPQTAAIAQNALPEYIQEFFLSEAVRSQERGEVQLTVAGLAFRQHQSSFDGKSANLDFEYGITRRLQFGMELPYGIQSTDTSDLPVSWSTVSVSGLYQFIRSNHPFALSTGLGIDLPVDSRAQLAFEPELLAAKQFGTVQIHASFIPQISEDERSLAYNLAAVHPIAHNMVPTLEFSGRRNAAIDTFYATPGIYKELPHRLELGIGIPIGVNHRSSPIGAVVKMTWEFGGDEDDQ